MTFVLINHLIFQGGFFYTTITYALIFPEYFRLLFLKQIRIISGLILATNVWLYAAGSLITVSQ